MAKQDKPPLWTTLTTPENVAEVHRQLFLGIGPYEIAKKVQAVKPPMFPDRKVNDVTVWFNAYRMKNVVPEQNKALGEAVKFSGRPGIKKRLDVISELEELAVTNRDRFAKGLKWEANSPIPLDAVSKLGTTLAQTLEKLAHLYLETGLMHRVPKKVEASLANLAGGRPLFTFTEEEAARFSRDRLIEGMVIPDREEDGDDSGI